MLHKAFILVLIFVLASLAVIAQESSELPEDANACNEGGEMEGKCNIDFNGDGEISDYEIAWAWTCGWYMIRYDARIFVEVPSFCQSLLPSEPPADVTGGDEEEPGSSLCYIEAGPNFYVIYDSGGDGVVDPGDPVVDEFEAAEAPPYPKCVMPL